MTINQFPDSLIEVLNSLEFEESGVINITQLEYDGTSLNLQILLQTGEGLYKAWTIKVDRTIEVSIKTHSSYSNLQLYQKHPLLFDYNDFQTSLYFGKAPDNSQLLLEDLYKLHLKECEHWIPFNQHLNYKSELTKLWRGGIGLFATGSIDLLEKYKILLEAHGMNPTIVGGYDPKGKKEKISYEKADVFAKVLIIGESYVIGEYFEFV